MQKMTPFPYFSAVLFDRDGTLIEDKHYLADPHGVELLPGCKELVAQLMAEERKLFVVSNQSGIGRGMFSSADADACNAQMVALLELPRQPFEAILYCPHAPAEECLCRKPGVGMWETLRRQYVMEAGRTLMVGDKVDDLLFAHNAGLGASVLVLTGKGQKTAADLDVLLARDEEYRLLFGEQRPGYPQIVVRDCRALVKALPLYEQKIASSTIQDGSCHV